MIEVRNLSYSVGRKKLLQDINLEVGSGEMLSIIGANGAGKSTLMKLLSRDLKPDTGRICLNGKELADYSLTELARMRSVLAQHNTISMSFTVKELVLMGRYPHFEKNPSPHDIEVIKNVMEETGITHLVDREYNTLSGGEQQRVQLARVIVQIFDVENGFLLLDEPTNGLDIFYQQQILIMARALADKGFCVVSILHDINFASRYADKILMLKDGKTVAYGSPVEVISCENIHEAFRIKVRLMDCEDFKCPLVVTGVS